MVFIKNKLFIIIIIFVLCSFGFSNVKFHGGFEGVYFGGGVEYSFEEFSLINTEKNDIKIKVFPFINGIYNYYPFENNGYSLSFYKNTFLTVGGIDFNLEFFDNFEMENKLGAGSVLSTDLDKTFILPLLYMKNTIGYNIKISNVNLKVWAGALYLFIPQVGINIEL